MDVPVPSRRRCRESAPSVGRNVRPRCPRPDLTQSRRWRRDEAAAATFALNSPRLDSFSVATKPIHLVLISLLWLSWRSFMMGSSMRPNTAPLHSVSYWTYLKPPPYSLMLCLHTCIISTELNSSRRTRGRVTSIVYTHLLVPPLACNHRDSSCLSTY